METDSSDSSLRLSVAGRTLAFWGELPRSTRIALVISMMVLLSGAVYAVVYRTPADASKEARREAERILASVAQLMALPDEEPIIATVVDPAQLADQPFFHDAQVGDRVLIYNVARKAILYRPEAHLIVDVAPLSPLPASPAPAR